MQIPLEITFRNMEPSEAVEAKIREKVDRLERFAEHITSCRVVVDIPHKHQHQGYIYHVKVDITLPGKEIISTNHSDKNHAHEDVYVVLRDVFSGAQRQLEDYVRQRRGDVKTHEAAPSGIIAQLFPHQDYGVIKTLEGREIYFHRNSVIGADFDKLTEGSHVNFNEEMGEEGPQASSVHVV